MRLFATCAISVLSALVLAWAAHAAEAASEDGAAGVSEGFPIPPRMVFVTLRASFLEWFSRTEAGVVTRP